MTRLNINIATGIFVALLLMCIVASILLGAMMLPLQEVVVSLWQSINHQPITYPLAELVVLDLRLPRTLTALLVGASLAAAGVVMQGLFRNPLADPSLLGVSSGASLGAVCVIVFAAQLPAIWLPYLLPLGAFVCGSSVTYLVYRIASVAGRSDTALLLLAGIAINAMASAGIGLMSYIADDAALRDLTLWSMGSVSKSSWLAIGVSAPILIISTAWLLRYRKALNALAMGESVAYHIGHDIKKIKPMILLLTTLIVSTAVSISGIILFVGLVVPHLLRIIIGVDHRFLLPLSMVFGATVLLLADIIARLAVPPAELPIGLIMALVGGPFFLFLLIQQRSRLLR